MVLIKKVVALLTVIPCLSGFVLISGEKKARLDTTPEDPVVSFVLSDNLPGIKHKELFKGGAFQDLADAEFWRVLVVEAMAPWNSAPGSHIRLILADSGVAVEDDTDGIHAITVGHLNLTTAAVAHPTVEEGVITDCDILLGKNTDTAVGIAYALMHELGHCIGIGHNHTNYAAVMGYSRTNRSLQLGADDIAAVAFLYPEAGVDPPEELVSCGSIGARGGATALTLLVVPMGAVAMGSVRWRRKSRRR